MCSNFAYLYGFSIYKIAWISCWFVVEWSEFMSLFTVLWIEVVVRASYLHPLHYLSTMEALKQECLKARDLSYSPYSKFRVGAAVLYEDGTIITGANFENASYPVGICAERSALITGHMSGHGHKKITAIAVSADVRELVSPCGICRQFIREVASVDTPILMYNCDGELTQRTLEELLPLSFGPENLLK